MSVFHMKGLLQINLLIYFFEATAMASKKSNIVWARASLTHAPLHTSMSQQFYHKLYKSGFSWAHDSLTHAPLHTSMSEKFYQKLYNKRKLLD